MEEKKLHKRAEKARKRNWNSTIEKGPFFEMNQMGYENHPLYSQESALETQLATLQKKE